MKTFEIYWNEAESGAHSNSYLVDRYNHFRTKLKSIFDDMPVGVPFFDWKKKKPEGEIGLKFSILTGDRATGITFLAKWKGDKEFTPCYIALDKDLATFRKDKLDEVLVHEMIHVYLAYKGIRDKNNPHGTNFKTILGKVNSSGLLDFSVSLTDKYERQNVEGHVSYYLAVGFVDSVPQAYMVSKKNFDELKKRIKNKDGDIIFKFYKTKNAFFSKQTTNTLNLFPKDFDLKSIEKDLIETI